MQFLISAQSYENSAHLMRVLCKAKPSPWTYRNARLENFLYFHESHVHPNYILHNSNVSLLAVEATYALFCVTEPGTDICDTQRFPFQFLAQFSEAVRLVILPVGSFHRLAHELGDPSVPVTMVHMTTRYHD